MTKKIFIKNKNGNIQPFYKKEKSVSLDKQTTKYLADIKGLEKKYDLLHICKILGCLSTDIPCYPNNIKTKWTKSELLFFLELTIDTVVSGERQFVIPTQHTVYLANLKNEYQYLKLLRQMKAILKKMKKIATCKLHTGYYPLCLSMRVNKQNSFKMLLTKTNQLKNSLIQSKSTKEIKDIMINKGEKI